MRLLFFRHAEPDYEIDGITSKGTVEAELLSKNILSFDIDEIFVSPLGRAKETAGYSLKRLDIKAETLDWLKEFPAQFDPGSAGDETRRAYKNELKQDEKNGRFRTRIIWDVMPSYYADHPELFDVNGWRSSDITKSSDAVEVYDHVTKSFDLLLKDHGYERKGSIYEVSDNNEKTLAFFCHFGITCVLLSHLWNVSPFVPLQFLAMAPTSLTEVVSEEREKGIAVFRTLRIGDITHLAMGNEKPSFSARFCERFENDNERH